MSDKHTKKGIQVPMGGIFISYRREDTSYIAGRLHDRLIAHFGAEQIFRDIDTIRPGVDFVDRIHEAVNSCAALVAVIGEKWLAVKDANGRRRLDNPKDFVRLEIAAALERNILVVPVLVENAQMPKETELPTSLKKLSRRNALDLTDKRWSYDVQRLIDGLQEAVTARAPNPTAPPSEADSIRQAAESVSCVVRWAHPDEMEAAGANRVDRRYGIFLANPSILPARNCRTALWSSREQGWFEIDHGTIPATELHPDPYVLNVEVGWFPPDDTPPEVTLTFEMGGGHWRRVGEGLLEVDNGS